MKKNLPSYNKAKKLIIRWSQHSAINWEIEILSRASYSTIFKEV